MTGRWSRVGPAIALAVAVAVGGGLLLAGDGDGDGGGTEPTTTADEELLDITSDAPRFERLEDLVAASDLVVRGTIVAVEPGRVFGEPGATAVRSRVVTVAVDEVLATPSSPAAAGSAILVEEPGWLEDGTPVAVDHVPPSVAGTEVVWFLDAVDGMAAGGDGPTTYVVVGPQGHYRVDGDDLAGVAEDDELGARLAGLGVDGLVAAVRALVPAPGP